MIQNSVVRQVINDTKTFLVNELLSEFDEAKEKYLEALENKRYDEVIFMQGFLCSILNSCKTFYPDVNEMDAEQIERIGQYLKFCDSIEPN